MVTPKLVTKEQQNRRYTTYLIVVAVLGWALASFDSNLLALTLPDITDEFGLSGGLVGILGFVVFAAEFVLALFVGYGMDRKGRRWMWMFCLAMAALLTGLTYFVQDFWQLVVVRALASGFAQAELAVSITLLALVLAHQISRGVTAYALSTCVPKALGVSPNREGRWGVPPRALPPFPGALSW